jgi:hypothetical protein
MSTAFRVAIMVVLGPVIGVLLISGLCSVSALTFSVACGHNAGLWLLLTVPLGMLGCWVTLGALARHYNSTSRQTTHDA